MRFEDELSLREQMLSMGQVLPRAGLSSARAIHESSEENRKRAIAAIEADRQRDIFTKEADRQRTADLIETNKKLSDAAIHANREIAAKGIKESKRSSNIALWIAIASLLLTVGSLIFNYRDSKESKVWMESELNELKTANTNLGNLNADYSKVIESQKEQLQELKTQTLELKSKRGG